MILGQTAMSASVQWLRQMSLHPYRKICLMAFGVLYEMSQHHKTITVRTV